MIGFAPTQTTNFHFLSKQMDYGFIPTSFGGLSHNINPLMSQVSDPNRSHIHPSTHTSPLGASPKSGGFRPTPQSLSRFSNKLLICWHVQRRRDFIRFEILSTIWENFLDLGIQQSIFTGFFCLKH